MNFIETLHLETMGSDRDSIRSLFDGVSARYGNSSSLSMESSAFTRVFRNIASKFVVRERGNFHYTPVEPYKVTDNWLVVKEHVIQTHGTFTNYTVATICGHILKSRAQIAGAEELLDTFIKHIAALISDPTQLNSMSGMVPVVTEKNGAIHGIPALERMIRLDGRSQVKLETLFASVSDMNVAVAMCNDLNQLASQVDLVALRGKIDRLIELMEILEGVIPKEANRKNVQSLMIQTSTLAQTFSDISYVVSVADHLSSLLNLIHDVVE